MKILLLGEYSNVHNTLASGLKALGHEVLLVSNGDFWKDYPRDISLVRKKRKLGGIAYLAKVLRLLPRLRGFDVVQLINPMFLELKAERLFPLYNYLFSHNRSVVLGAFGMDYYWVQTNIESKPLRYSDFNFGDTLRQDEPALRERKDWIGTKKEALNRHIAETCSAIVSGLYEYYVCYEEHFHGKNTFIPFPIVPRKSIHPRPIDGKMRVFIGINKERSTYKGTDIMLRAAREVERLYADRMTLQVAQSVPFERYCQMVSWADVMLDQLYSYTPAMNALMAMSQGVVVVGGGEEEQYGVLQENSLRPIINVEPTYESVFKALQEAVLNPLMIEKKKRESLLYIERHHDYIKVAKQYERLYKSVLEKGKER